MRVVSLGSSSSGNALLVEAGPERRTKILIDAALHMLGGDCGILNREGIVEQIHILAMCLHDEQRSQLSFPKDADRSSILLIGDKKAGKSVFCDRLLGASVTKCSPSVSTSDVGSSHNIVTIVVVRWSSERK